MSKPVRWIALIAIVVGAFFIGFTRISNNVPAKAKPQFIGLAEASDGFERANGPRELVFPRDFGAHDDFQTEWWYYTGNLLSGDGREYGYQLTFFRRALSSPAERVERDSAWAADQIYLAHFTVTDVTGERFFVQERFERGAAGLAGAQGDPAFKVWLQDWNVVQLTQDSYRLTAYQDGVRLQLDLIDQKGAVLQGDRGYSQKGSDAGNASYYFSQTRMAAQGSIVIDGQASEVSGWSWMDHEFSTSALEAGQVGWDWFSIQLDDNTELMFYTIRRSDGTIDRFSKGTVIDADGSTHTLAASDFHIEVESTWRSPHSGAEYPSAWQVEIPSEAMTLQVSPKISDQELNVSIVYWEGAVQVDGNRAGKLVTGSGYVELTGYAQSLESTF